MFVAANNAVCYIKSKYTSSVWVLVQSPVLHLVVLQLYDMKSVYYSPLAYTVGVGVGVNFMTTDMEDEPPFLKGLHCVATVTKQFCRFHLHLSPPLHQPNSS